MDSTFQREDGFNLSDMGNSVFGKGNFDHTETREKNKV